MSWESEWKSAAHTLLTTSNYLDTKLMARKLTELFRGEDVFERSALALWTIVSAVVALVIVYTVVLGPHTPHVRLAGASAALLLLAWALLSLLGTLSAPESARWKWAKKCMPDGTGEEGLVLGILLYLPALLLAVLVRRFLVARPGSNNRSSGP